MHDLDSHLIGMISRAKGYTEKIANDDSDAEIPQELQELYEQLNI